MAKKEECCYGHKYKGIFFGIVLLLAGYMMRQGYDWPEILMLVGGLLILKVILIKFFWKN